MNLGFNTVSSTYKYLLTQSGANPITLGDNSSVNWSTAGLVSATGGNQTISGIKTFDSPITSNEQITITEGSYPQGGKLNLLGSTNNIHLDNYNGDAKISAGLTEIVRFKSDGNVGIGTNSPTNKLTVNGEITSSAIEYGNIRMIGGSYGSFFRNDGYHFWLLSTSAGSQYEGWNTFRPFFYSLSDGTTYLGGTNTITALTALTNGNVGIGTNSPTSKLEIQKTAGADASGEIKYSNGEYWTILNSNTAGGSYNSLVQLGDHSIIWGNSNSTPELGSMVIGPWSASAKGLRITNDGNVGIGTSSPTQTLHVTGSIYANSFTGNSFTGNSFRGDSFTGNSFRGDSFIGNSFTLQNTNIKLLSPVSLTSANTWYDVTNLSGTLNSGTWLMNAMALYSASTIPSTAAFRVLNSTSGAVYASAMQYHTNVAADLSTTNISTIINLTSATTVKLQALSSWAGAFIIASGTGLANSGSATQLSFVKIS